MRRLVGRACRDISCLELTFESDRLKIDKLALESVRCSFFLCCKQKGIALIRLNASNDKKRVDAVKLLPSILLPLQILPRRRPILLLRPSRHFLQSWIFTTVSVETKLNFNHSELSFLKLEYLAKMSKKK